MSDVAARPPLADLRRPPYDDPAARTAHVIADELEALVGRVEQLLEYCEGLDRVAAAGVGTLTTDSVRRILGASR